MNYNFPCRNFIAFCLHRLFFLAQRLVLRSLADVYVKYAFLLLTRISLRVLKPQSTLPRFISVPSDHRQTHPSWVNSFSIPPFTDGVFHSLSWLSDKSSSTAMCQTTSLNQDCLQNYTAGSIVSYRTYFYHSPV
jgi:hypothetical protein